MKRAWNGERLINISGAFQNISTYIPWFIIGGIKLQNISYLRRNGFKKVALVSQLMNSEDPKEDAIMIIKELTNENQSKWRRKKNRN